MISEAVELAGPTVIMAAFAACVEQTREACAPGVHPHLRYVADRRIQEALGALDRLLRDGSTGCMLRGIGAHYGRH